MVALVDLYNNALGELGDYAVTDPTENSNQARACQTRFPSVRDAVLRAHPWNCAIARMQLPAETETPVFGFSTQYALPTDPFCLRVLELSDRSLKWRVEGRKLLTSGTGPVKIRFIKRITDTEQFDTLLSETIEMRLASAIAIRITTSRTLGKEKFDQYLGLLAQARSVDGQEGTPDDPYQDDFLDGRG